MEKRVMLLIRHGEVDPLEGFNVPTVYGPDEPLTDHGFRQSVLLARRLKEEGIAPDLIYSSPFIRAKQTASVIHDTLELHPPVYVDPRLRGADTPQWDHRPASELALVNNNIFADNPMLPDIHGETMSHAYERVTQAYEDLLRKNPEKIIAVVTHGENIGMLMHRITTGKESSAGMGTTVGKGEAYLLHLTPEGSLIESRRISGEQFGARPEMRY